MLSKDCYNIALPINTYLNANLMNAYYQNLRELGNAPGFFTDEMRQEMLDLQQQLEDGAEDETFPWERYEDLITRKCACGLPENYQSIAQERGYALLKEMKENIAQVSRALLIPITPQNAGKHVQKLEGLKFRSDRLSEALRMHYQLEALADEMFAQTGIPIPVALTLATAELSAYLAEKCPIELCDNAAALAGLHPDQSPRDYRDLRIHAFTDALKTSGSLQSAMATIATVRQAVALRYGVVDYNPKYGPQHTKGQQGRNAAWDDCQTKPYKFLTKHYSRLPR